jgi:endogenous inhibitor of DNA gyrase (YacG/DUF329 family)
MKCPICKKKVSPGDPEFPFCSERCRVADLANWATEKYVFHEPVQFAPGDANDDDES